MSARQASPSRDSHVQWLSVYAATWLVIVAPILAADDAFGNKPFTTKLLLIAAAALAASYWLSRVSVSRLAVNSVAIALALGWGVLEVCDTLALLTVGHPWASLLAFRDAFALRALIQAFLWIGAFRALTLRTHRDHTLTTIPSISALVLLALLRPDLSTVMYLCVFLFGAFYLLAADRTAETSEATRARPQGRSPARPGAPVRPLLATYGGSIAIGMVLCAALIRISLPRDLADRIRLELAQHIANVLIASTRRVYAAPEAMIDLAAGAPMLSDTVMFRVRCSRDLNWRLAAYDVFDGRRWGRSRGGARPAPHTEAGWLIPAEAGSEGGTDTRSALVRQEFHVVSYMQGVLAAAYRPARVVDFERQVRTDKFGGLNIATVLGRGDQYVVLSAVRTSVRRSRGGQDLPSDVRATYVSLPPTVSPRVLELATSIVASCETDLQRATAIEAYLLDGYTYDARLSRLPRGRDPLDYFLFESRRGYCHHFATAMAMLSRAAGVPARLATGFLPGESEPGSDWHVVREADAHSWAEVFIPGAGWMTFDPAGAAAEARLSGAAAFYQRMSEWWQQLGQRWPMAGPGAGARLAALLSLLLAAALLSWVVRRLWLYLAARERSPAATDVRGRVCRAYRRACLALARAGLPKAPSATPLEFAAAATPVLAQASANMLALTDAYLTAVYGPRVPEAQVAAAAEAEAHAVVREARRLRFGRRTRSLRPRAERRAPRGGESS